MREPLVDRPSSSAFAPPFALQETGSGEECHRGWCQRPQQRVPLHLKGCYETHRKKRTSVYQVVDEKEGGLGFSALAMRLRGMRTVRALRAWVWWT